MFRQSAVKFKDILISRYDTVSVLWIEYGSLDPSREYLSFMKSVCGWNYVISHVFTKIQEIHSAYPPYVYIYISVCVCVSVCVQHFLFETSFLKYLIFDPFKSWLLDGMNFGRRRVFHQGLSPPTGGIYGEVNNEITSTVTSYIHLYKD